MMTNYASCVIEKKSRRVAMAFIGLLTRRYCCAGGASTALLQAKRPSIQQAGHVALLDQ